MLIYQLQFISFNSTAWSLDRADTLLNILYSTTVALKGAPGPVGRDDATAEEASLLVGRHLLQLLDGKRLRLCGYRC